MKKILFMFAFTTIISGTNAQVKIINNGNVGIGTSNPRSKLEVVNNDKAEIRIGCGNADISRLWASNSLYAYGFGIGANGTGHIYKDINTTGYIMSFNNNGNISMGTTTLYTYRLYVVGNLGVSGGIYSSGSWISSDSSLKSNILPINNALSKVMNLKGKTYSLKNAGLEYKKDNINYGFIAQEVEKAIPDLVTTLKDSSDLLAINYDGFIPILVEAIKEQQNIIDNLQQELKYLKACCNTTSKQKSTGIPESANIWDANNEEMRVYQNAPNPFTETTTISCFIPETIRKAELCIYDMKGSRLKCLSITERGTTSIQIQAGQLASGVYTYLVIGDGKTSDAKQMILTQ